jgi:hypothetical protein
LDIFCRLELRTTVLRKRWDYQVYYHTWTWNLLTGSFEKKRISPSAVSLILFEIPPVFIVHISTTYVYPDKCIKLLMDFIMHFVLRRHFFKTFRFNIPSRNERM